MAFVIKAITKGVSTGIGLAGEKYEDRKDRKNTLAEQKRMGTRTSGEHERALSGSGSGAKVTELINTSEPGEETANDERIWALDEVSDLPDYKTSQARDRPGVDRTVSDLVHEVAATREAHGQSTGPLAASLPYPIIIPQRRPGTKARGWARAYPPDLEAIGVDEVTFLQFLQNFENAQQASPWLKTVYVAGSIVGFIPGHITMAVSISVQIAAGYVTLWTP